MTARDEPTTPSSQVRSRQRVIDHAEVFTNPREVNAMLDLVKQETERIESRFLEPACGTGNFLVEILARKLRVAAERYGRSRADYDRYVVLAVTSVYGVDILDDNVVACRQRLAEVVSEAYRQTTDEPISADLSRVVEYVLSRNIIWGDALTLKTEGANPQPIVFSEWSPVMGNMFKRRDYAFEELLPDDTAAEPTLFGEGPQRLTSDRGEPVFLPRPLKEYPLTHYLRLPDAD